MTVVGVPARFISVDIVGRSIAVATCSHAEEDAVAASAQKWKERLSALLSQKTLPVYDFDSLRRADLGDLPADRIVVKVDDLNECGELTSCGLSFEVSVDEEEQAASNAELLEFLVNRRPINWQYWIGQLVTLNAGEAARLMCGLDPDVYVTLEERLKEYDATKDIAKSRQIERLALRNGKEQAKGADWLTWAHEHDIRVHVGFVLAVRRLQHEQAQWAAGEVQHLRAEHELRQALAGDPRPRPEGFLTIVEAARALAAANPQLNEAALRDDLAAAAARRQIDWVNPATGGKVESPEGPLLTGSTLFSFQAINKWLAEGYRVSYRLGQPQTKLVAPDLKQNIQEQRILEWIREAGEDPLNLPKRTPGKPWIKAAAKQDLLKDRKLFSAKSFEKAWERLSGEGRIAEGRAPKA